MRFHDTSIGPRWLAIAGVASLLLVVVISVIAFPVVRGQIDRIGPVALTVGALALLAVVAAGVLGMLRRITIAVGPTHLDARLVPLRVMHVPLSRIVEVRVADVDPAAAGGIGWRIVGRRRFVLWSAGPAVWVTLSDGSTRVLRTDRADDLRAALSSSVAAGS